ncbi:MAG: tRNA guanosine(34) transglycosylase Tgt [Pirellulales bacterium]
MFSFQLHRTDPRSAARRATFTTPHGLVALPAFMPVGTLGTVKGLTIDQLRASGAEMVLGNAYHLALRPGDDVVAAMGGLHAFMGWDGPILTDSGGFQLVSLADRVEIDEQGALFRSHIDGSPCHLTPERSIEIQQALGSDVAMVLDHVVPLPNDPKVVRDAMQRTVRWAERCRQAATRTDQALFAIVQGGLESGLRRECAERLTGLDFDGYAVGGLSVGEKRADMLRAIESTTAVLPADRPRYLMGVGRPQDLLEAVRRGIDLFDCVLPTRNGRNGLAFTRNGPIRLRNKQFERDRRPLESACPCPACGHSRAYLRHLFMAREMLGPILLSVHNLTHYQRLMRATREAIEKGGFEDFCRVRLEQYTLQNDE